MKTSIKNLYLFKYNPLGLIIKLSAYRSVIVLQNLPDVLEDFGSLSATGTRYTSLNMNTRQHTSFLKMQYSFLGNIISTHSVKLYGT